MLVQEFMEAFPLCGQRLVMRPYLLGDADVLARWMADPRVTAYFGQSVPNTVEAWRQTITELLVADSALGFLIMVGSSGEAIGIGELSAIDRRQAACELEIALGEPSAWGRGYASEAVDLMLQFAAEHLRMHRVYADVLAQNTSARRMLETARFVREGTLRDSVRWDGRYHDQIIYGKLLGPHEASTNGCPPTGGPRESGVGRHGFEADCVVFDWRDPACAGVYREVRGFPGDCITRAEVDRVLRLVDPPEGAAIVDVGCGVGRHSVELARRGFRAIGLDPMEPFISEAREFARRAGVEVEFYVGGLGDIEGTNAYDLAWLFDLPLGYVSRDELVSALAGLGRSLVPGGRLLLIPQCVSEDHQSRNSWRRDEGTYMLVQDTADPSGLAEEEFVRIDPESATIERFIDRRVLYTLQGVQSLLEESGFLQVALHGTLQAGEKHEIRNIFTARR